MELAVNALKRNLPSGAIKELLQSHSGLTLSMKQMSYIKYVHVIGKDKLSKTPAEKLIDNLEANDDSSFVM